MSEPETLQLFWDGPIRPFEMETDVAAMERLQRPGVYLCIKRYTAASRLRVYAGVTKDFRTRLREHVAATLGMTYDIVDETGRVVFAHTHRDSLFEAVRNAEILHPMAVADVKRMTWFCALDDSDPYIQWNVVEGLLIQRLKALAGATSESGDVIDVVNEKGGAMPSSSVVLRNGGAEEAVSLLGDEIHWPLENAA